jgi:hypothetical protein
MDFGVSRSRAMPKANGSTFAAATATSAALTPPVLEPKFKYHVHLITKTCTPRDDKLFFERRPRISSDASDKITLVPIDHEVGMYSATFVHDSPTLEGCFVLEVPGFFGTSFIYDKEFAAIMASRSHRFYKLNCIDTTTITVVIRDKFQTALFSNVTLCDEAQYVEGAFHVLRYLNNTYFSELELDTFTNLLFAATDSIGAVNGPPVVSMIATVGKFVASFGPENLNHLPGLLRFVALVGRMRKLLPNCGNYIESALSRLWDRDYICSPDIFLSAFGGLQGAVLTGNGIIRSSCVYIVECLLKKDANALGAITIKQQRQQLNRAVASRGTATAAATDDDIAEPLSVESLNGDGIDNAAAAMAMRAFLRDEPTRLGDLIVARASVAIP